MDVLHVGPDDSDGLATPEALVDAGVGMRAFERRLATEARAATGVSPP